MRKLLIPLHTLKSFVFQHPCQKIMCAKVVENVFLLLLNLSFNEYFTSPSLHILSPNFKRSNLSYALNSIHYPLNYKTLMGGREKS